MKTDGCIVLLVFLLDFTSLSSGQQSCSRGEFPSWPGQSFGDNGGGRIPERTQVILPNYEVSCNGSVMEWHVDLSHRGVYCVALQVWRQSSSNCYSLVGLNILSTSIPSGTLVTLHLRSTPASQIAVKSRDVVGFSVINAPTENSAGVNIHTSNEATMVLATSTIVDEESLCLTSTTTKAPVISVLVETSTAALVVQTSTAHSPPSTTTMMVLESSSSSKTNGEDPHVSSTPAPTTSVMSSQSQLTPSVSPAVAVSSSSATTPVALTTDMNGVGTDFKQTSQTVANTQMASPTTSTMIGVENVSGPASIAIPIVIVLVLLCLAIIVAVVVIAVVIGVRKKNSQTSISLFNPNYNGTELSTISYSTEKDQEVIYENPDSVSHVYAYIETAPSKCHLPHPKTKSSHSYIGSTHDHPSENKVNVCHDYDEMQFVQEQDDDSYQDPNYRMHTLKVSDSPNGDSDLELVYQETMDCDPVYMANVEVFDSAGTFVLTGKQRKQLVDGHYDIGDTKVYNKTTFFVEDQDYWAPANTASALYEQLAAKRYREIPRHQISPHQELGSGQFGKVLKSAWSVSGAKLDVAVKMLRTQSSEEDNVKFLQEAAIMGQFMHKNIVKLYGVVTVGEPVMICLEMLKNGDLRQYLNNIERSSDILQHRFLKFAREIAAGMGYLSSKSFVHRDLAARNILLNDSLTCKIGDFGMARDLMDDTYYTSKGGKIPVKWTAPEAIFYNKYSTDSDVWSYGMVLFEIWSVGRKPFSQLSTIEVLVKIQNGYCQAPPPGCPRPVYQLMVKCWCPEHENRPNFNEICTYLRQPPAQLITLDQLYPFLSSKANILGEELEHGKQLYLDLQHKYEEVTN